MGSVVQMPCPISEWARITVTLSSPPIRRKALAGGRAVGAAAGGSCAKAKRRRGAGTKKPTTRLPPTTAERLRNERRESSGCGTWGGVMASTLHQLGGAVHGAADALVRAAPAEVAAQRGVDLGVARLRLGLQQGRRRQDLAGLAVAALDDVDVGPGPLHGMVAV